MRSRILLGFIGEPDLDVGTTVAFLASDGARNLTGHTFLTDGGTSLLEGPERRSTPDVRGAGIRV